MAGKIQRRRAQGLPAGRQKARASISTSHYFSKNSLGACLDQHISPDFSLSLGFERFGNLPADRLKMICQAGDHLMPGEVKCGGAGGYGEQWLGF